MGIPRGSLVATVAACLSCAGAHSQNLVSIDESNIRALLKNNETVVSVPLLNTADRPIEAELALTWLDPADKQVGTALKEVVIPIGASTIETAAALRESSIWTRLRYNLTPSKSEARTFGPLNGIVGLPQIADYAFELQAAIVGVIAPGKPITVHAQAIHPVSRHPISDAEWSATLTVAESKVTPRRIVRREGGFVDFLFEVSPKATPDTNDEVSIAVTAQRGDFEQITVVDCPFSTRLSAKLQTDKPIYQPGQSLHVRAVVLDAQGRAASGAKVALHVEDQNNERAHTVELVTSKFGVVHDDWAIPASASLGAYRIWLTAAGDDGYHIGSHQVRVSRYELPSFTVTAKPDRTSYLPAQSPHVTITGTFLFGKPVSKGRVKIVRLQEEWLENKKPQPSDQVVSEGEAGSDGSFAAEINIAADQALLQARQAEPFEDLHFAAYYTDVSSHRTEQRRFDLRITREPIHIYLIPANTVGTLFVSTSYADGRPAPTGVEVRSKTKTAHLQTNKYGVGKIAWTSDNETADDLVFSAADSTGQAGTLKQHYWQSGTGDAFRIESPQTIHRTGQAVSLRIESPPDAPPDQLVTVDAIASDRQVSSRIVHLTNHHGEVTFPFQPEFRRTVLFVAWRAVQSSDESRYRALATRAIVFPDDSDLEFTATAERSTYKPGNTAALRLRVRAKDGTPVQAVLALAVVDQAVMERERSDVDFGRRNWFSCAFCADPGESEIGGVRLNDLYSLKPSSPITPELDLVAEALVATTGSLIHAESSESIQKSPPFSLIQSQTNKLYAELNRLGASAFPKDLFSLNTLLQGSMIDLVDPWVSRTRRSSVSKALTTFCSCGVQAPTSSKAPTTISWPKSTVILTLKPWTL